jgi:hypothetical protein
MKIMRTMLPGPKCNGKAFDDDDMRKFICYYTIRMYTFGILLSTSLGRSAFTVEQNPECGNPAVSRQQPHPIAICLERFVLCFPFVLPRTRVGFIKSTDRECGQLGNPASRQSSMAGRIGTGRASVHVGQVLRHQVA